MNDIRELLKKENFHFNKAFGQNFITDANLLSEIVKKSGISKQTVVVEIGAGAGTLTRVLAENAKRVIAFEIDQNLKPVLERTLTGIDNVQLYFEDIMRRQVGSIYDLTEEEYCVVANLPYYITTPVVMRFTESERGVQGMSVMVQKEVAKRFCARENTSDYGAVTVAIQSRGDANIVMNVGRNAFYPVPNVDSAVVKIDFYDKYSISDRVLFKKVYRSAFAMRRKTLENNLVNSFTLPRETAQKILTEAGVDLRARGETLSVEKMIILTDTLSKYIK